MIRFLFGRPGTGKTYRVVEEIRERITAGEERVMLIVPEQQAYSAERDILSALPPDAGRRFSIFSFSRLCDAVADLYGGRTRHTVTRAMKALLMWENLRTLKTALDTYGATATDAALSAKMLATVEELRMNGVTPELLDQAAEDMDEGTPLYGKLRDLAAVFAAFDALLTDTYGENPSDRLTNAARRMDEHGFFENTVVYVDSFTSFTAQEYAILRSIIEQAQDVTVTLGCNGRFDRAPQFESLRDTARRLTRLCEDARQPYEDISLTHVWRTSPPELLALEQELWELDLAESDRILPAPEDRGSIRLVSAADRYEEARAMALHILELHERGIEYGEIAVVVRDTEAWRGILDEALDSLHIPYFLSERTDVNEKPAARLLLTALRCVARRYQTEDILTLCKTGLLDVSLRELDYFQEYVETWRLSGKRMTESNWSMNPDGYTVEMSSRGKTILQAANRVRDIVMPPLMELDMSLRAAKSVEDQCRALYGYLCALNVRERLAAIAEEYLTCGQAREAGELVRLWSFLTETLASVATVMQGKEPMKVDDLAEALSIVFSETDIGSVPALHDCVTVGSASTLRVDSIRATLVLGLCEGEFPRSIRGDGLLSEQDKEILSAHGIELSSRTDRQMSDELLYIYHAVTKPSEALILSYSTADTDGSPKAPSAAFNRVSFLFPYIETEVFSSRGLGMDGDSIRYRTPAEDVVSRTTVRAMLGDETWLSQSKLQTYAKCPYSYYGSHILRLREPTEAKFDNLGAGVFLHHVMEQYLRRTLDEQNRIRPVTPAEVEEIADEIILAYMQELCGDTADNGRLLRTFDRLRHVAIALLCSIQDELSKSRFSVAGLEWNAYGRLPTDPLPMKLLLDDQRVEGMLPVSRPMSYDSPLPESAENRLARERTEAEAGIRLLLGGRIDRVDLYRAEDGETVYIRVVDYKSSLHEFSVASVTENLNIQLLLYLFTLCSPENRALFADAKGRIPKAVIPASAVYISPDETSREGHVEASRTGVVLNHPEVLAAATPEMDADFLPSVHRDKKTAALRGKGLFSREQMLDLEGILQEAILDTAASMYAGKACRTPSSDACKYCVIRSSCALCEASKN